MAEPKQHEGSSPFPPQEGRTASLLQLGSSGGSPLLAPFFLSVLLGLTRVMWQYSSGTPPRPFWFPRGLHVCGSAWGGPLRPARPPTLVRPIHPSWGRADDAFVPTPSAKREATSQRECAVLHRVALTDTQVAKRLRGAEPTRTAATDYIATFLYKYRTFSTFAEVLVDGGEPFSSRSVSHRRRPGAEEH